MTSKPSNPKDAVGIRKMAFSVLPWRVLAGAALAMMEGAAKYGRHNYRAVGVRASVYFDAVVGRHLTDWWEGVDIDEDSGLHHVDKAIAGLMVMRDSMLQGNFVDDRPPRGGLDMVDLNAKAAAILDRHADKHPKHYTIADDAQARDDVSLERGEAPATPPAPREDGKSVPEWHGGLLVLWAEEGSVGGIQVPPDDPATAPHDPPGPDGEAAGLAEPPAQRGEKRSGGFRDAFRRNSMYRRLLGDTDPYR